MDTFSGTFQYGRGPVQPQIRNPLALRLLYKVGAKGPVELIKSSISTKVKGQDRVDKLLDTLKKYRNAYVTIGIHEDAGTYGESGTSVIEVALWNEFGTEKIPARSFIRSALDEHEQKINEWREEVVTNILTKGWSIEKALDTIGLRIQLLIQNQIKSNVPPSLAKSTADAKSAKGRPPVTLIDTGLLLRSITYKKHLE